MASECTQEAVLRFLIEKGGRVKNRELIDHFKVTVSRDPSTKTTFKETLKRFVDNVAFVRQENGDKFVCLKKKYREAVIQTVERDDGECNGNGLPADGIIPAERNGSCAMSGVICDLENGNERSKESENGVQHNTSNLNMAIDMSSLDNWSDLSSATNDVAEQKVLDVRSEIAREKVSGAADGKTEDVSVSRVALSSNKRLLAQNYRPISATVEDSKLDTIVDDSHLISSESTATVANGISEEAAPSLEVQSSLNLDSSVNEIDFEPVVIRGPTISVVNRRRTSRGSQRSLLALSEDGTNEAVFDFVNSGDSNTPKSSRKNFIELMMSSSPQVRRTLVHRNSQSNMSVRNRESVRSEGDTGSLLSGDEDCASVMLDPLEHEWMMCASDGQWDSLQRLLVCDPNLITKRDFVTGFTCLHWAAKQGKQELLANLVTFAKEHDIPVNINARSSAGYTPLHLAAMHSHVEVMKLLVGAFDADVEVRDYSGKKASQYLSSSVSVDLKDIIGGSSDSDVENAESGAGWWRLPKVLPSNLNPLRLLNHPDESQCDNVVAVRPRSLYRKASIGRIKLNRNRFKTQIVHSTSFRETDEGEGSLKSPVKSRPVSNLFG
ncbi:hypothetical protein ACEWY4_023553 [Coilia grayii]|uniref:SOWAHA-C winged helix-turn-helix domain-containing protein n=1 Tax=Coilia grayii TaxID=363190 RepID=A0ABD1J578_9TELE